MSLPPFLRVLATSDIHMHLMAHDYFADRPAASGTLERLAPVIAAARHAAEAQGAPCLLVDNGDLLQGTPLAEHLAASARTLAPHPAAQVLDALRYDAVGLGNHDFDYGLEYLAKFAADLAAPVLSSNLHLDPPADWLQRDVMLERAGLRIGLLSVLPSRTEIWAHAHLSGRGRLSDMTRSCREAARRLRARGADLVIALAHTGIGTCPLENALAQIAADGEVDALIGGHTHLRWPAPGGEEHLSGVPTVMPGYAAEALGCIDLHLSRDAGGAVTVARAQARLLDAAAPAPETAAAFAPLARVHRATCTALDAVVGHAAHPLTSYMALVQPTHLLDMTAAAMQTAMHRAQKGTSYADLPVLAAVSPSRCGGTGGPFNYTDIPAGPMRKRHVAELHYYPNDIWGVPVTGAELRDWLERAALLFSAPGARAGQGLIAADARGYDFDVLYGLTYCIDPTAPARFDKSGRLTDAAHRRIHELTHAGRPVADTDRFLVAASSYRASGGGQFPGLHPAREMLRCDLPAPQVMQTFIAQGRPYPPQTPWRFAPAAAGLRTWFDTSPGAERHLGDIAGLQPRLLDRTAEGFLRVEITL